MGRLPYTEATVHDADKTRIEIASGGGRDGLRVFYIWSWHAMCGMPVVDSLARRSVASHSVSPLGFDGYLSARGILEEVFLYT